MTKNEVQITHDVIDIKRRVRREERMGGEGERESEESDGYVARQGIERA